MVKRIAFVFVVITLSNLSLASKNERINGYAYDIVTGELRYTEEHVFDEGKQHRVFYREADGKQFAEKLLDYSSGWLTPQVLQINNRLGEKIEVVALDSENLKGMYRASQDSKEKVKTVRLDNRLVVDAGFNYFIKHQWHRLITGERIEFDYLVPTRLSKVRLAASKIGCEAIYTCFKITAANRLLAMVIKPIRLVYLTDVKQLYEFEGRSNIASADGSYETVIIKYQPASEAPSLSNRDKSMAKADG